ncbi:NAD(+) diphosphatase [Brevundimonas sp. PAMC22021]|uniref:NAD(+) diphosphatase n=1 Tax=Brevundimonas sp. PAMC22021 TaxID=2861285 RepID=UPI001C62691A|nr:NAD(+) diphosphatase [Brevundimonas sp. PAMC22021]QYF87245.1 NAD(+) diphosphatase [Brevundimonas sp. PAMC22021]
MTPINTFAGSPLDRAGDLRQDPAWLAEQEANPQARALVLWEGRPLLSDDGALVWLSLAHARDIAPDRDLFLGLDGEAPVFAVEIEGSADPAQGPLKGMGVFSDLRSAAAILPDGEAAMAGAAKSLFDWRRRHGFCAACGTESRTAAGGWKRKCPACGTEHFPRVDPVVIMLPVFNGGPEPLCLLGRQASWPQGRMSALAGFLEPGESIEEACAREVAEEAGLRVTRARYHSSQPWPFPSQLMIGLIAEVDSEEARPDQTELEAVAWLTRADARALLSGAHPVLAAPPPTAIAHQLIRAWVDGFPA